MKGETTAFSAVLRAAVTVLIGLGVATAPPASATASDGVTARTGRPVMGTILQVTVIADTEESARRLVEDCVKIGEHWDDEHAFLARSKEFARLAVGRARYKESTQSSGTCQMMDYMRKRACFHRA